MPKNPAVLETAKEENKLYTSMFWYKVFVHIKLKFPFPIANVLWPCDKIYCLKGNYFSWSLNKADVSYNVLQEFVAKRTDKLEFSGLA